MRFVLVGNFSPGHIGASLLNAARQSGLNAVTCSSGDAFAAPRWLVGINWHLLRRRPPRLGRFSKSVVDLCRRSAPELLLTTGCAPINARALDEIGALGIRRVNYSTDDPWSRVHRSAWLLTALKKYDAVFSPRTSNLEQLRDLHGPAVDYLPFAFDPALHVVNNKAPVASHDIESDVLFVGGADQDRVTIVGKLIREGFDVALYGGYWDRYALTRAAARGLASPERIRHATYATRVCLCLVRRSNRDGHVMRSFEMAALGACMLVEDTKEHREIFGKDGEAVVYFHTSQELVSRLRWLLSNPLERIRLAKGVTARVATQENTYASRLSRMLQSVELCAQSPVAGGQTASHDS
jgi:spore maturation protein CgeB